MWGTPSKRKHLTFYMKNTPFYDRKNLPNTAPWAPWRYSSLPSPKLGRNPPFRVLNALNGLFMLREEGTGSSRVSILIWFPHLSCCMAMSAFPGKEMSAGMFFHEMTLDAGMHQRKVNWWNPPFSEERNLTRPDCWGCCWEIVEAYKNWRAPTYWFWHIHRHW